MQMSIDYNKPIWNTEEHVYKHGFDCEISLVHAFNQNYIQSAVTKIVCWYLVSSVYPIEPYPDITVLVANSPVERPLHGQSRALGLRALWAIHQGGLEIP